MEHCNRKLHISRQIEFSPAPPCHEVSSDGHRFSSWLIDPNTDIALQHCVVAPEEPVASTLATYGCEAMRLQATAARAIQ